MAQKYHNLPGSVKLQAEAKITPIYSRDGASSMLEKRKGVGDDDDGGGDCGWEYVYGDDDDGGDGVGGGGVNRKRGMW